MKKVVALIVILISLGFFWWFHIDEQENPVPTKVLISSENLVRYVEFFDFERSTPQNKLRARTIIEKELEKLGYEVREQKNEMNGLINILAQRRFDGGEYILVGAHYDTVPDSPGADDNASAVAVLLALASKIQDDQIRFVFFDGEELSLSGSKFYVSNESRPQQAIILEMLGYTNDASNSQKIPRFFNIVYRGLYNRLKQQEFSGDFSIAVCARTMQEFCDRYEGSGADLDLKISSVYIPRIKFMRDHFTDLFRSDHTPFLRVGVPAVMITDTGNFRNPNYHKTTDTIKSLDLEYMAKQTNALLHVLENRDP